MLRDSDTGRRLNRGLRNPPAVRRPGLSDMVVMPVRLFWRFSMTGMEIGGIPPMGPDIGMPPPTGREIETTPPTSQV
jgi:hypothetical protein